MLIPSSRKKSPVKYSGIPLFFSLVDYRNNYFSSNDPNKIIEFYNGFENRDQLIQWMRERPKGVSNIHEVDGDKDIIVVIPTADFNGKYARECRENIFKGLHIVFVESGEVPDPYFNYAHNCNVGIRKAMEYNPKWVILSNDDIDRIDDIGILRLELNKLDSQIVDFVICEPSYGYHSTPVKVMYPNKLGIFLYYHKIFKNLSQSFNGVANRLKINLIFTLIDTSKADIIEIQRIELFKLYFLTKFFFHDTKIRFFQLGAFGIISGNLANKLGKTPYNEDYINGFEDIDLSYRITMRTNKISIIHYNVRPRAGSTLGNNTSRDMRNIIGRAYLNSILQKDL